MRRVTTFCVLLASSLLLLLHGACSEHAFCRNAREIPKEIERDGGKSVKLFDPIMLFESKNVSPNAMVSKGTNCSQKLLNCQDSGGRLDLIFVKLTKVIEHSNENMRNGDIIRVGSSRKHPRIQRARRRSRVMRGYRRDQIRLATRARRVAVQSTNRGRRSRMRTHRGERRRITLQRQVTNSAARRRQVSKRRRTVLEKRSKSQGKHSSFRRTEDSRQLSRFCHVSARRSIILTDHRRTRPVTSRIRVTTQAMQSSRSGENARFNAFRIRHRRFHSRTSRRNIARLSQRRVRRRNFVSKRIIDTNTKSSARSRRRQVRNLQIRRTVRHGRETRYRNGYSQSIFGRRNGSLRRSRRDTRNNNRYVRENSEITNRSPFKRSARSYRFVNSRERQRYRQQRRTIRQYRGSAMTSRRRYRRAINDDSSRFSIRRASPKRRIYRTRSRQVSRSRISYISLDSRKYFGITGTNERLYHDDNSTDVVLKGYVESDVKSDKVTKENQENVMPISSTNSHLPTNDIPGYRSTKQVFASSVLSDMSKGKYRYPFDPFQCSKIVVTAIGVILGTRIKHV